MVLTIYLFITMFTAQMGRGKLQWGQWTLKIFLLLKWGVVNYSGDSGH
jgi:hypothetical protein